MGTFSVNFRYDGSKRDGITKDEQYTAAQKTLYREGEEDDKEEPKLKVVTFIRVPV